MSREKKRKRATEDFERPVKRTSIDSTSDSVSVSILSDTEEWAPVIASSPGLSLDTLPSFKPYRRPRPSTIQASHGNSKSNSLTSELLLQSSSHPTLEYLAREERSCAAESLLKHYIGVFNPKTQELQLVQAYNLTVRAIPRPGALKVATAGENSLNARNELGLTFGTKKSQKAILARTENAISSSPSKPSSNRENAALDPLASAVIDSMDASSGYLPSRAEMQKAMDEVKPRPRRNPKAEIPAEVYPLEELVGGEALKMVRVKDWQDKINSGADVTTKSRFVSRRLQKLVKEGNVVKLKALRYLLALLDFYGCLRGGNRGGKKVPKIEEVKIALVGVQAPLIESILERFATGNLLNKWHVDYMITHICALAITVDDFDSDTYDLREDLKLESKDIIKYFVEIGAKITTITESERAKMKLSKSEAAIHKVARLRLPLVSSKDTPYVGKKRR